MFVAEEVTALSMGIAHHDSICLSRGDGATALTGGVPDRYASIGMFLAVGSSGSENLRSAEPFIYNLIAILNRPDHAVGLVALPKIWVVDRSFAWIGRLQYAGRSCEVTTASTEAYLLATSIRRAIRPSSGT